MTRHFNIYDRESCDSFVQKCDNPLVKQFKEIPPYAVNPDTGEFLNTSKYPILIETDPMNIQDYIDSFDDRDIYSMIKNLMTDPLGVKKAQLSADMCGDTTIYPKNIHEADELIKNGVLAKDNLDPRIVEAILDDEKLKTVISQILSEKKEVSSNE